MQRLRPLIDRSIPVLLGAGMLLSCRNDLDKVAAVEVPRSAPDRTTTNAVYDFSEGGHVRNRLFAGKVAEWNADPRTELSEGLELRFLDTTAQVTSVLTARRGIIVPKENRMEVSDNVVFINAKGERLETEHLVWDQDSARVYTDRPVQVQRKDDVIFGDGLLAAEDMSWYTIRRPKGSFSLPADDTLATSKD